MPTPGLIDELVMRFEKPNPGQRWDNPCFVLTEEDVEGVVKQVADHLFSVGMLAIFPFLVSLNFFAILVSEI